MSSLMFYCLKVLISAIFQKRMTNRRTDQRMDKASYRDVWMHLKIGTDRQTTPTRVEL